MTRQGYMLHRLRSQQDEWRDIVRFWEFDSWVECGFDTARKKRHLAISPSGQRHEVHWSPYSEPDLEDQAMLIAIGFGTAARGANWDKDKLRAAIRTAPANTQLSDGRTAA